MTLRTVFRDAKLQARFEAEGYVILPLLDQADVDRLSTDITEICPADLAANCPQNNSYISYFDRDRRQAVSNLAKSVIGPQLAEHLTGYRIMLGGIYRKNGHAPRTPEHVDPPLIADFADTELNCWCPLADCDEHNGVLQIVPRSHKLLWHPFTMNSDSPPYWSQFSARLEDKYLKPLNVRAGEAVIFDNSLLHASCQNQRDEQRLVLISAVIPNDGVPAFYVDSERPGGGIEIYRAFNEFSYADTIHEKMPPRDTWELLGTLPDRRVQLNEVQFDALLANGVRIATDVDPYEAVASLGMAPASAPPQRSLIRRALGRLRRAAPD